MSSIRESPPLDTVQSGYKVREPQIHVKWWCIPDKARRGNDTQITCNRCYHLRTDYYATKSSFRVPKGLLLWHPTINFQLKMFQFNVFFRE